MCGLWWNPVLPECCGDLHITNAPMAGSRITIDISGSAVTILGLPEKMVFHHGSRPSMADLVEQARRRGYAPVPGGRHGQR